MGMGGEENVLSGIVRREESSGAGSGTFAERSLAGRGIDSGRIERSRHTKLLNRSDEVTSGKIT